MQFNQIKKTYIAFLIFSFIFLQSCASAISNYSARNHADIANNAAKKGDWDLARRHWAKAVVNADLGKMDPATQATYSYEYGRATGVTCSYDLSEKYLLKAYELDKKTGGPGYMSLNELFRLSLAQEKYKKAIYYFEQSLPKLKEINAPQNSPAEYTKLLEEYSQALKAVGNIQKAKEITNEFEILKNKYPNYYSMSERTPYGSECKK